jgi:predicted GIY-YIG superfamily endonuclease
MHYSQHSPPKKWFPLNIFHNIKKETAKQKEKLVKKEEQQIKQLNNG